MEQSKRSLADLSWSKDLEELNELTGGSQIPSSVPVGKEFSESEIDTIYLYASFTRNGVDWRLDETGGKVGFTLVNTDAWCE